MGLLLGELDIIQLPKHYAIAIPLLIVFQGAMCDNLEIWIVQAFYC